MSPPEVIFVILALLQLGILVDFLLKMVGYKIGLKLVRCKMGKGYFRWELILYSRKWSKNGRVW